MWRERAACRDVDPELFYPLPIDEQTVNEAKAVCRQCPVIAECHTDADKHGDPWGIRGGLTAEERAQIRMIGRPCQTCADQRSRQPKYCSRDCARAATCGTHRGASGHRKHGEPLCSRCRAVKAADKTERKHRRRAEAA